MNERKNNGRGIFYGVIGVATLVVAIIGATFAYFTATATNNNVITGNMTSVSFGLEVVKVTKADEELGGMIPMSNTMVEAAIKNKSDAEAVSGSYSKTNLCTDDNGNAVCQIYKITVYNQGTASMFVDGFVSLTGGSGVPEDAGKNATNKTTMRWAQVFCSTGQDNKLSGCTTAGNTTTGATGLENWAALDGQSDDTGFYNTKVNTVDSFDDATGLTGTGTIAGNSYPIITNNYIRISNHSGSKFTREDDMTSALVINQNLAPKVGTGTTPAATLNSSSNASLTDAKVMYIVVWLSENGHNQTAGAANAAASAERFFNGVVTFNSAQGSEVTATFTGYTAVASDSTNTGSSTEPSNP